MPCPKEQQKQQGTEELSFQHCINIKIYKMPFQVKDKQPSFSDLSVRKRNNTFIHIGDSSHWN